MPPLDADYMRTLSHCCYINLLMLKHWKCFIVYSRYWLMAITSVSVWVLWWELTQDSSFTSTGFGFLCSTALNGTLILHKNIPYMTFMPWILLLLTVHISSCILGILKNVNRSLKQIINLLMYWRLLFLQKYALNFM